MTIDKRKCLGTVVLAAFLGTTAAYADDSPRLKPITDDGSSGLTGGWGGWRHRLAEDGVIIKGSWVSEIANNPQGGTQSATRYTDQWAVGASFDLDRLLGIPNAGMQLTISERNGRLLDNDAHFHTLQQTQEVFGRGQTFRLTELWYDQSFLDNLVDIRLGRMPVGSDFFAWTCDFMNLTFCGGQPGNLVGDYWFNYPVSQWAGRVKLNIDKAHYLQIGAYEVNPGYNTRRYAFTLEDPPNAIGALIPLEFGWLPTFSAGNAQLPGSYKFGAWYATQEANDVVKSVNGVATALNGLAPLHREGRYGIYMNLQQTVMGATPTDPRNVSVFLNTTFADHRTSTVDRQISFGAIFAGFVPFRPRDDIMIGLGTTHVNDRVHDNEVLINSLGGSVPVQSSEYALEVDYTARLTPWFTTRPNFQFINQPGGNPKNHNIMVIGLKSEVDF